MADENPSFSFEDQLFECPVVKCKFQQEGDLVPVRNQPCRCIISKQAAGQQHNGCAHCGTPLDLEPPRVVNSLARIQAAIREVNAVDIRDVAGLPDHWQTASGAFEAQWGREHVTCRYFRVTNEASRVNAMKQLGCASLLSHCQAIHCPPELLGACKCPSGLLLIQQRHPLNLQEFVQRHADRLNQVEGTALACHLAAGCDVAHTAAGLVYGSISMDTVWISHGRQVHIHNELHDARQLVTPTLVNAAGRSAPAHAQPAYLCRAPECMQNSRVAVSPIQDAYSVGMVVYEAMWGPPYKTFKDWSEAMKKQQAPPIPAGVDEMVVDLVRGLLDLNPSKRMCVREAKQLAWHVHKRLKQSMETVGGMWAMTLPEHDLVWGNFDVEVNQDNTLQNELPGRMVDGLESPWVKGAGELKEEEDFDCEEGSQDYEPEIEVDMLSSAQLSGHDSWQD